MSKPIGTPREQKRVSGDLGSLGSFDSMDFGPPANPDALRGTRESNAWVVEDISHPARKPDRFRRGVYIEDHDGG